MEDRLTIGELARRSGLAPSAIRFYERVGLLAAERSEGGQRRFRRDVLRRVAFIRVAQRVGLSLEEIAQALAGLPADRAPTREDWRRMTRTWRDRIDQRITLLEALRQGLGECIGCGCLSLRTCALSNPDDWAATLGSGPRYLLTDT
ncbi:MAG TPA: redox-sensitive transcriptional activator SoxR [Acidimicrobiales bacterium]|nr:redox-sensitive transcriptional activator SoxR [Acidimicrobiales bacterium]